MIDKARKLAILIVWQNAIKEADAAFDPVVAMLGLAPESRLCQAVWRTQEALTKTTSILLDDGENWLSWYWLENDMGSKGLMAGSEAVKRPIWTFEDLIWVMEVN